LIGWHKNPSPTKATTPKPRANTAIFDLEMNDITLSPPAQILEIPGDTIVYLLGNP
jgi:hypothetical protein